MLAGSFLCLESWVTDEDVSRRKYFECSLQRRANQVLRFVARNEQRRVIGFAVLGPAQRVCYIWLGGFLLEGYEKW